MPKLRQGSKCVRRRFNTYISSDRALIEDYTRMSGALAYTAKLIRFIAARLADG